jgi:hypothetical protein
MVQGTRIDILSRRFILDAGDVQGCAMLIELTVLNLSTNDVPLVDTGS